MDEFLTKWTNETEFNEHIGSKPVVLKNNISKILLPDNEHRVSYNKVPLYLDEYIQDGMIFWLDASYRGNNPATWKDIIRGIEFTNYGATFNSNNVYFAGTQSSYMKYNGEDKFPYSYSNCTIEVVFKPVNINGIIFFNNNANNRLSFYVISSRINLGANNASVTMYNSVTLTAANAQNKIISVSSTTANTYLNGELGTSGTLSNYYNRADSGITLGLRNWNGLSPYPFKGYLYCIRIYNRRLTLDEVTHNYLIDKERFNI